MISAAFMDTTLQPTHKICVKCNLRKRNYLFGDRKDSKDGKQSYCLLCQSIANKLSRAKKKEKHEWT